ncbi:MAG: signal recognition particle-docking protein FtsY [bacterium]
MVFWNNSQKEETAEDKGKLKGALENFKDGIKQIWPAGGLSGEQLKDLETALLRSDVSLETVDKLLEPLRENTVSGSGVQYLREQINEIFAGAGSSQLTRAEQGPTVYFFIGVNGSGKTTTMAKLASELEGEVLFAAADTFRAAAIDQLGRWAEKLDLDMIAHKKGSDPSAVVFDALEAAESRKVDYLMVDTAGRLHTRGDLMSQLKKMYRITEEKIEAAPHESLLVLDASTGQNGLQQVKTFAEELPITGLILTKLDSTARGGIALSVADELQIPVKLVGTGEKLNDLVPFEPDIYCEALLAGAARQGDG